MRTVQDLIELAMKSLDYNASNGVCAGLARMWVQAFLCDEEKKFYDRINLVIQPDFIKKSKKLLLKTHYLEAEISAQKKLIRQSVETLLKQVNAYINNSETPPNALLDLLNREILIRNIKDQEIDNNYFTPEENKIRDALIFFDGISVYSLKIDKNELFSQYNQGDILPLSRFTSSIELDKRGGLNQVSRSTFIFTKNELQDYFSKLTVLLRKVANLNSGKIAFTFDTDNHEIGLCYDYITDRWQIKDNSQPITEEISPSGVGSFLTNKLVSYLLSGTRQHEIGKTLSLFGDVNYTLGSLGVFTTNENPNNKKLKEFFDEFNQSWIITKDILQRRNISGHDILFLTTYLGDIKTFDSIKEDIDQVILTRFYTLNNDIRLRGLSRDVWQILYPEKSLLQIAIIYGQTEIAQFFIEREVNVKSSTSAEKFSISAVDAAKAGNFEIFKLLIERGADVTTLDRWGNNLFYYAAMGDSTTIIEYLIAMQVDINKTNNSGDTPLFKVAEIGNIKALEIFAKHGAHLNVENNNSKRPIDIAAEYGHIQFMCALIEYGICPNQLSTKFQESLAHFAAKSNQVRVIHCLSNLGGQLDLSNKFGIKPIHIAVRAGSLESIIALSSLGIDIYQKFPDNRLPVSIAIEDKKWNVVVFYLLTSIKLESTDLRIVNQCRKEITEEFIKFANTITDQDEKIKLVLSVIKGENTLGTILNNFIPTLGFFYSTHRANGKQVTKSIATIIDMFSEPLMQESSLKF
ncbi:ankyrin repeat domain-containing protein (plasmid) [Legionella sp. D16C41]|uniref:ankyrin repeat domain-containing protein n=1 Tax=Legionella sp. D16C41 TaxID=3402688 RepID=UPI003AF4DAAC